MQVAPRGQTLLSSLRFTIITHLDNIWSTFVVKNSYCKSTCIHLSLHTHCRYLFNMSCFSVIPSEPAKMFIQNGKSIHVFLYIFTFW